ncbi:protein MTSS 1-like [Patiria miniata]|uniref:IMD domain-containing protein n=1 Tax=Patiria miniata TaxID=46514 RepID=A0A914ATD0_PATMI|nr:protein MTSS 1-like [Patiria miniata]
MEVNAERDCSVLGGLFQTIINDMKGSVPVWEDFTSKASKLHTQLKTTIVAVSAFLEAFQRIADIATNSRAESFQRPNHQLDLLMKMIWPEIPGIVREV